MPNILAILTPLDRKRIVHQYISNLKDRRLLLVCKLYSLGRSDYEVRQALKIDALVLELLKRTIANGILETMKGNK